MCRNSHKNILYDRLSRSGEPDNMRDWFRTKWKDSARDGGREAWAHCFTQPSALCNPMINTSASWWRYITLSSDVRTCHIFFTDRDCFHPGRALAWSKQGRGCRGGGGEASAQSWEQLPEPEIHPHRPLSLLCNLPGCPGPVSTSQSDYNCCLF